MKQNQLNKKVILFIQQNQMNKKVTIQLIKQNKLNKKAIFNMKQNQMNKKYIIIKNNNQRQLYHKRSFIWLNYYYNTKNKMPNNFKE